jgi:hypothetical protein
MVDMDIQNKLAEYEDVIRLLTAKVEELAAANEALKADLTAHQTLKAIYADPNQPATVRVRAAQAALSHESAPLKPVEAPLDLTVVEVEPLAVTVEKQRARADRMLSGPPWGALNSPQGNGSDDDDSSSD